MKFREFAPSLWHLLGMARDRPPRRPAVPPAARQRPRPGSMRSRYDALVVEMKRTYGVRVRRWRSSTTGCAWVVQYHDGAVSRLIESPYPRGPMSCAIFLHEIGHHAIGFNTHRLRCLEEYDAWRWALQTMREKGFNVTAAVEKRMEDSVRWAVSKARRRGLKKLPVELLPFA